MMTQPAIGFLHIGKTGGTALRYILEQQRKNTGIMPVRFIWLHYMTLPRIRAEYPTVRTIFFVRDPISRFISGFNSRLRQGLPRHRVPWSPEEAIAFQRFTTPNQLAEAIEDSNAERRAAARAAMGGIRHVRDTLTHHLVGSEFLADNVGGIFYIGDLASFVLDVARLKALLHINEGINPPTDDIGAHRSPKDLDRQLSHLAMHNLRAWYKRDYAIYHWCQNYKERAALSSA